MKLRNEWAMKVSKSSMMYAVNLRASKVELAIENNML